MHTGHHLLKKGLWLYKQLKVALQDYLEFQVCTWPGVQQPGLILPVLVDWLQLFPSSAAAAKSLQLCPTLCDPIESSPPGSLSPGFSRQEHWSGLPFPSPMHESEVTQLCPTLSDPMDCSLPGSSIHGIFQARILEWGAIAFSGEAP